MPAMTILVCPFCGKQPRIWEDEADGPGGPYPTGWVMECCVTMFHSDKEKLIERWNSRY